MSDSTTQSRLTNHDLPQHIAIIMDGNGRWAKRHFLPRLAGYKKGLEAARSTVAACIDCGIPFLTLFAFSTENWRRSVNDVTLLMRLFLQSLKKEALSLASNNIRFRVIGRRDNLSDKIVRCIQEVEALTNQNTGLNLTIAVDYGGRWDIVQAVNTLLTKPITVLDEATLSHQLSLSDAPEPDLFIRTGGEQRVSNFLLWQLAYTELYFTDLLWPDFDRQAFDQAMASYRTRQRRFGRTSEQI